jgi:uncharacterized LabA/DUF88 family protein
MAEPADPRVAVYIDFDNIVISRYDQVYGRGRFMADKSRGLDTLTDPDAQAQALRATVDVGAILDYATSFGTVVISRAFADWSVPANSRYSRQLVDRAVDLTQLFPTAHYTKNGADIRLSVDVVEDMFRLPDITHVVIVAGDSDFIPLAQRCKRLGRYVVGIGVAGATSRQLAAACNEFAYYGELPGVEREPLQADPSPADDATVATDAAPPPAKKKPATRRRASSPQEDSAPPQEEATETVEPVASATELLVRAMRLGHAKSDDEWLHSGSIKSQMLRMDPSFNEKSLGFKSFSDFLKSRDAVVQVGKGESAGRLKLRANSR